MLFFRLFNLLLMSISWTNVEVEVPVFENISNYINIPEAKLISDGEFLIDPDMYYVINAVDNTFINDINTNYLGIIRHTIKVVFPNYYIESKQEIIFNVVDKVKPTIGYVPEFYISLNQAIPDLKLGLEYSDNYWEHNDITVKILGQELINNKKVGKYTITYQIIDKSHNIATATTNIYVVDNLAPEITKLKDVVVELSEPFLVYEFYKITDNHDQYIDLDINLSFVNFDKIGTYPFSIAASDQSGNETIKNDVIKIVHTKPPEIHLNNLVKIEVHTNNYESLLKANIKSVYDKVDNLLIDDVVISDEIDINVLGNYNVKYFLTNSQGTKVVKEIKISIVDETKPQIKIINDLIINVYWVDLIFNNYFEISDNYTPYSELTIKYVHSIKKDIIGVYALRVEVTDKQKNIEILETEFQVVDQLPPTFLNFPNQLEIKVYQTLDLSIFKIIDNYDKNSTFSPMTIYVSELGTFEYTITAIDSSGNESYHVLIIEVVDKEAPYLMLSTNEIKLSVGNNVINPNNYINDYYDNFDDLSIENLLIIDNVKYDTIGIYEIIYYLTDNSGNETIRIISVIVDDTSPPIIKTYNHKIKKGSSFNIWDGVEIEDADNNLELTSNPTYINTQKSGTYLVTYTAIDSRGNISSVQREIVVYDAKEKYLIPVLIGVNFVIISSITLVIYIILKKKRF